MTFKLFFHYLSYLQYPLMLTGLFFAFKPYLYGLESLKNNPQFLIECINTTLIFMGLGISFSSLQDTTKTQNNFSKKIWENPRKGKIMIVVICVQILIMLTLGLIGYFSSKYTVIKDLSIGLMIFSLGMFGFLKAAIEVFENHRKDKN